MAAAERLGLGHLAGFQGAQDAFVLVPDADAQIALAQRRRHHPAQMLPVWLGGFSDHGIARSLVDEKVEIDVGLDDRRNMAAGDGAASHIEERAAAVDEVAGTELTIQLGAASARADAGLDDLARGRAAAVVAERGSVEDVFRAVVGGAGGGGGGKGGADDEKDRGQ